MHDRLRDHEGLLLGPAVLTYAKHVCNDFVARRGVTGRGRSQLRLCVGVRVIRGRKLGRTSRSTSTLKYKHIATLTR